MATFRNTDGHARIWPKLTNATTGRTLELAPNEAAELDTDKDLGDPYLRLESKTKHPKGTQETKTIPSAEAETPLAESKE